MTITEPLKGADHKQPRYGNARSLLVCLLFVAALRLPFLNQAIQGDDLYYLAGAEHALIEPLHPNHTHYVFQGRTVDMRGHPHPPLNCWLLAALLRIFGDVYEVPFHGVYLVFSLLAAAAMWFLARRFCSHPTLATLLFLVTPAFVISGSSLEADLPFIALLLSGAALFVYGADANSSLLQCAAVVALALAAMTAYQAVLITPILVVYSLRGPARQRLRLWLVAIVPVLVVGAWQIFERATSGHAPISVLNGYMQQYGFWGLKPKLDDLLSLVVHAGWLVFPVLSAIAFRVRSRVVIIIVVVITASLLPLDFNPLFWASFCVGALLLARCAELLRRDSGASPDERFLAAWVAIYFAGAVAIFFAGAARYLLPVAAPVAILTSRFLRGRRLWLISGLAAQLCLSLLLAKVNYDHWDGYRQFVLRHADEIAHRRTWVAAEWGLRFYAEAYGALPLTVSTPVQPEDLVLTSALADAASRSRSNLVNIDAFAIRPRIPFRLIGLGTRSCFQTAAFGLRQFDISTAPIDVIRVQRIVERQPTVSWLPMNAPEAAWQIVNGLYSLEEHAWRWMGSTATFRLKPLEGEARFVARIYVPPQVVPCHVTVALNQSVLRTYTFTAPGPYEVEAKAAGLHGAVTATISTDKTFHAAGDERALGLIVREVGLQRPLQ